MTTNMIHKVFQKLKKIKLLFFFIRYPDEALRLSLQNGDRINLFNDEMALSLYVYNNYENTNRMLWEKIVSPGMTVIDIGAHWGIYSISASRLVRKEGKVFSFEPNPEVYERLRKNILLNQDDLYGEVIVQNCAVSDYEGCSEFHVPLMCKSAYGSLHRPNIKEDCDIINVSVISLDHYVERNKLGRVDLIKIDVEGAELTVLKGAEKVLRRFYPMIFMEVSDKRTKAFGYKAEKLCSFLEDLGYELYCPVQCYKQKGLELTPFTADGFINYVDVFAVPNEGKNLLREKNIAFAEQKITDNA